MDDDFNSPIAISKLFDGLKWVAAIETGKEEINENDLKQLQEIYQTVFFDILGLTVEEKSSESNDITNELMSLVLDFRKAAKSEKDFATADKIRDALKAINISIKDGKDGAEWSLED